MSDQMINNIASRLYGNTQALTNLGNNSQAGQQNASELRGPSFGDILQTAIQNSVDNVRAGEQASARAVTGDATLQDVVGAITQAELTLETVVAIRDRLTSAYQEIMRMPI